jgi:hypothetical protein
VSPLIPLALWALVWSSGGARVTIGAVLLAVGAAFLPWAVWRLAHPRRPQDAQWQERHRVLDLLLSGVSPRGKPYPFDRVGAISMLLSGLASIGLGIFVLASA